MQLVADLLGALSAGLCGALLLRAYARRRLRLLLWSGVCFAGLAASNALQLLGRAGAAGGGLGRGPLAAAALSLLLLLVGLALEGD